MITLIAPMDMLKEGDAKLKDIVEIPSENIVHEDLVFTLHQDPSKLYRPVLIRNGCEFMVVANKCYFRAAANAGLRAIKVDVIPDELISRPEILIAEFGFEPVEAPSQALFKNRFLYFKKNPITVDASDLNIKNDILNGNQLYNSHNCLRYSIPVDSKESELKLIERATSINGLLRSLDGIKGMGLYKNYFG
jgi:hypothetical protein